MVWDAAEFLKQFDRCRDQASSVRAPLVVRARAALQGGAGMLVGRCPRCGELACLSGEGKHLCRKCGAWLRYVREA